MSWDTTAGLQAGVFFSLSIQEKLLFSKGTGKVRAGAVVGLLGAEHSVDGVQQFARHGHQRLLMRYAQQANRRQNADARVRSQRPAKS